MDQVLRAIPNYPGYRINRLGQVQSCWSRHARPARMSDTWLPLKPARRPGCLTVNLCGGGEKKQRRIHRLVLESWVGGCPPGLVCCHGDGEASNNDLANLRWDTPQANAEDARRHGTMAVGSRCNPKLTEGDLRAIRRLGAEGVPPVELVSGFGVTPRNVWSIVTVRSWRHWADNQGDGFNGHVKLESRDHSGRRSATRTWLSTAASTSGSGPISKRPSERVRSRRARRHARPCTTCS